MLYNENHEIAAEAHDIIVFYDFSKNTKLAIPDEIRNKIERLEMRNSDTPGVFPAE